MSMPRKWSKHYLRRGLDILTERVAGMGELKGLGPGMSLALTENDVHELPCNFHNPTKRHGQSHSLEVRKRYCWLGVRCAALLVKYKEATLAKSFPRRWNSNLPWKDTLSVVRNTVWNTTWKWILFLTGTSVWSVKLATIMHTEISSNGSSFED